MASPTGTNSDGGLARRGPRRDWQELSWQACLIASAIAGSWWIMLETHELGHVLSAVFSGGQVTHVSLPLAGISRTDIEPNPHPQFVAWGGALWGVALPLCAWLAVRSFASRYEFLARFVAGFCLVANGAYLGAGSFAPAGDAADLLRQGAQPWQLVLYGLVASAAGLRLWHGQGRHFGLERPRQPIDRPAAAVMICIALAAALLSLAVGQ